MRLDAEREERWWIAPDPQWEELIHDLSQAEDEEDVGLYLLRLHFNNQPDLDFFTSREIAKIKRLLSFLMDDTAKHMDLLSLVILELKEKRRRRAA